MTFKNRGKDVGAGWKNRGSVITGGSFTNRGAEDQSGRPFQNRGQDWFGGDFKNRGQSLLTSAASWSPTSLFASSEVGVWYDPSDLTTLWQDTAGTVPVTADGQEVLRIDDKSGNGYNATMETATKRPLYKTSGGLHWLEFDGVNDALSTGTIDFSASDEMSIFAGAYKASDASTRIIAEFTINSVTQNGGFFLAAPADTTAGNQYGIGARGTTFRAAVTGIGTAPDTAVLSGQIKISTDTLTLRRNGTQEASSVADLGTGNFASAILYIGGRGLTSLFHSGKLYGMIVRGKLSAASEIEYVETWLAAKSGVTLPF